MRRVMRADPGVGSEDAPIGTELWAQRVRLSMQALVNHIHVEPEALKRYVDAVHEYRAWTMMNKPDGSYFTTWDEFCEHEQPWGLGKPWCTLKPFVEAAVGARGLKLVTAPRAAKAGRKPANSDPEDPNYSSASTPHEKRLRAIAERAPERVRRLFADGLIGAKEAARLGPKNPDDEQEALIADIVDAITLITDNAGKVDDERARRELQKRVNECVLSKLGVSKDPVGLAIKTVLRFTDEELSDFVGRLPSYIRAKMLALKEGILE